MKQEIITIRVTDKVMKKTADLIRRLASDEIYRAITDDSDMDIVRTAIHNIAVNGQLLNTAAIHFPRRFSQLPTKFLSSYQENA